jgi:YD repeat-containing protein
MPQVWRGKPSDSTTADGQATQFVYDGDGNRVKKVSPSGTVAYVGSHYEAMAQNSL